MHQTCWGVKLLPGGQRDLCRGPCPQCAVCHPWAGLIRLLCRSANREQHACNSGQGRHPWRTGPCLCMLHKKPIPSMVPPHPLSPQQNSPPPTGRTPPAQSLCAGCFSSSLSEVCMAGQWAFYAHETWNVSECSRRGPSLLSERALCPLRSPEREAETARSQEAGGEEGDVVTGGAEVLKRRSRGEGEAERWNKKKQEVEAPDWSWCHVTKIWVNLLCLAIRCQGIGKKKRKEDITRDKAHIFKLYVFYKLQNPLG